ncbi:MAG: zinc metallopeptidase [Desulfobacteraceae bacterium]
MNKTGFRVGVLPMGEIDRIIPRAVAAQITGAFGIEAEVLPVAPCPAYAFDSRRVQYNAGLIIKKLEKKQFSGFTKVVALFDDDLFIPVFSFVLGEARMGGRCALVSIYRLKQDPLRAVKVAMHEFGHLMSLGHCMEKGCVMNFSKDIEHLDKISPGMCRFCVENIQYQFERY